MADKDVVLIAGTICEWQDPDTKEWAVMPGLTKLGELGDVSESKEKTNLSNTSKRYGSGLRDAADQDLEGQYVPKQDASEPYYDDYLLQTAFFKACKAELEFNFRVNWPDGEVNAFLFKSLGFKWADGTQEDWKMFMVPGKQNSRYIYGVTLSGAATVAAAATTQLSFETDPANITAADYAGEVEWSSSDEAVVTVDANGLVTGVAAGNAIIYVIVRGVSAMLEIEVTA